MLFGGPLGYIVLGLFHPMGDVEVGDATGLYIFLHLVQPVLIALIAYGLWLLVEGLESTAATIVRYALVPYLILYSMFDAVAGVAIGLVVQEANGMSAADQAAVQRMMDGIGEHGVLVALWIGSGLSWLVPAVAAALAVRERVPSWVTGAMVLGALVFAVGHPFPPGPIGMALFLGGILWVELRPRERSVPEVAAPVPG
ncbi:MAG: hypothetical protein ABWY95_04820 [Thermoleophilaceae bacterium]